MADLAAKAVHINRNICNNIVLQYRLDSAHIFMVTEAVWSQPYRGGLCWSKVSQTEVSVGQCKSALSSNAKSLRRLWSACLSLWLHAATQDTSRLAKLKVKEQAARAAFKVNQHGHNVSGESFVWLCLTFTMLKSWRCESITAKDRRGISLSDVMLWPEAPPPNSSVLDLTLHPCLPYRTSPMSGCFCFCFSSRSLRYFPTRVAFPWRSSLSITSNTARPMAHDTGLPPNWERTTKPKHRSGPFTNWLHHRRRRTILPCWNTPSPKIRRPGPPYWWWPRMTWGGHCQWVSPWWQCQAQSPLPAAGKPRSGNRRDQNPLGLHQRWKCLLPCVHFCKIP